MVGMFCAPSHLKRHGGTVFLGGQGRGTGGAQASSPGLLPGGLGLALSSQGFMHQQVPWSTVGRQQVSRGSRAGVTRGLTLECLLCARRCAKQRCIMVRKPRLGPRSRADAGLRRTVIAL